jgi:hypothetical protein
MTAAELLPSLQALPRSEKLQLIQWLAGDLAREEDGGPNSIDLLPTDRCPYTPAELVRENFCRNPAKSRYGMKFMRNAEFGIRSNEVFWIPSQVMYQQHEDCFAVRMKLS